jgi:hypothetical protein
MAGIDETVWHQEFTQREKDVTAVSLLADLFELDDKE